MCRIRMGLSIQGKTLLLAIPAITWTLAPLPVLGIQLIFFIFLIKAIAQEAIQKLRC